MSLRKKQSIFAINFAHLIIYAEKQGYEVTIGEVYRWSRVQKFYIKIGVSWTLNSQHSKKLAGDLNLFKNGRYLSKSDEHRVLGKYWESLNIYNVWGGRFKDGNHYEMRHDKPRTMLRNFKYARPL